MQPTSRKRRNARRLMQSASNMTLRELINSVDSEQYSDSALYKKLRETKPEYGANRRIQVNKELK